MNHPSYEFEGKVSTFDSFSERAVAILLHDYGLAEKFIEGRNLHVAVGNNRHSLDFLVRGEFIEYHPNSGRNSEREKTLEERRRISLTQDNYFSGYPLHYIGCLTQLLPALQESDLRSKGTDRLQNLSQTQFLEDILEVFAKAFEYDKTSLDVLFTTLAQQMRQAVSPVEKVWVEAMNVYQRALKDRQYSPDVYRYDPLAWSRMRDIFISLKGSICEVCNQNINLKPNSASLVAVDGRLRLTHTYYKCRMQLIK